MFSSQVKYLSGLGGFGNRDVIKNIMQHVLTDDLAKEFNWQGRGEKKPFSQLILADVIRGKLPTYQKCLYFICILSTIFTFKLNLQWLRVKKNSRPV